MLCLGRSFAQASRTQTREQGNTAEMGFCLAACCSDRFETLPFHLSNSLVQTRAECRSSIRKAARSRITGRQKPDEPHAGKASLPWVEAARLQWDAARLRVGICPNVLKHPERIFLFAHKVHVAAELVPPLIRPAIKRPGGLAHPKGSFGVLQITRCLVRQVADVVPQASRLLAAGTVRRLELLCFVCG